MDNLNWSDNPEAIEAMLAGYALGDLTAAEMAEVEAYIAAHPAASVELAKLQATLALLPLALPESSPSPELRSRILAAAQPTPIPVANNVVGLASRRRWSLTDLGSSPGLRGTWIAGSIAAGLVGVLGFQNYRLTQEMASLKQVVAQAQAQAPDRAQLVNYQTAVDMLRQPDNRLITLKGMADQSSGSLIIFTMDKKASLNLKNVPPLPNGRMYRLWAMVEGRKVYCTEFQPDADGMVSLMIPLDQLGEAKQVAVTIDPQAAPTVKPVGDMVMSGAVSI
jgi:Anti-sigma-K factor rskA